MSQAATGGVDAARKKRHHPGVASHGQTAGGGDAFHKQHGELVTDFASEGDVGIAQINGELILTGALGHGGNKVDLDFL